MASIKSFVTPLRLFRYRSLAKLDQELSAIEQGYLHCSTYGELNDPMEGLFSSSHTLKDSEGYRALKTEIRQMKREIGVCSFSEVKDNAAMWAYYANQFQGMCVAYSLRKLLEHLGKDINFVRLAYVEEMPTIRRAKDGPETLAKTILSCKHHHWLHEREWRMLAPFGNIYYREVECVTLIYLGSKVEGTTRDRITNLAKTSKIKLSKMNVDDYCISFSEVKLED